MKRDISIFVIFILYSITSFSQSFDYPVSLSSEYNNNMSTTITGDFNGDFKADVGWYAGGGQWKIMLSKANSFFPSTIWTTGQGVNNGVWVGDFNGDSYDDKISYVQSIDDGFKGFWVALARRHPIDANQLELYHQFSDEKRWLNIQVSDPSKVLIGDFNGDGISDLVSYDANGSKWNMYICQGGNETDGGAFIASSIPWIQGFGWNSMAYVGDFNGDGKSDIISYVYGAGAVYDGWWVGLSDGTKFIWGPHSSEIGNSNPMYNCIGDFDGDGKSDIACYINNCWKVMQSLGDDFRPLRTWLGGVNFSSRPLPRDFTGDGKCDILFQPGSQYWSLYKSTDQIIREVGVWYYPAYYAAGQDLWAANIRDINKTPIAGWGADAIAGDYNCQDREIVKRQINAMKEASIDFVIMDITNGIASLDPINPLPKPKHSYEGDGYSTNGSKIFVQTLNDMKVLNPSINYPKFSVGLGFEFWGNISQIAYKKVPDTWSEQLERQVNAVKYVYDNLYYPYTGSWYKINNRPLLLTTFGGLWDYPFRNELFIKSRRNIFSQFYTRYGCEWGATYARKRWVGALQADKFIEGIDSKGFWGFGGGESDADAGGSANNPRTLPYDPEIMSIMPGTQQWNTTNDTVMVNRQGGDYYIKSWKQVLEKMPKRVIIGAWNNWNEELCIENCTGKKGWTDYHNRATPDWYLQITKTYSIIFKTGRIPDGTYVRADNNGIYLVNGFTMTYQSQLPYGKPVILFPAGWLLNHGYSPDPSNNLNKNATSVDELEYSYDLQQNFPNPFNPNSTIKYGVKNAGFVSIKVFNLLGQEVVSLVNEIKTPGNYEVNFDASKIGTGIYIYRMQAGDFTDTKKMLLMK